MIPCCVLRSPLKHAMEVVSLLLPLLSMVWRPWRAPPTIPNAEARLQPYGIVAMKTSFSVVDVSDVPAVQDSRVAAFGSCFPERTPVNKSMFPDDPTMLLMHPMLFALRIDVCKQQQEYFEEGKYNMDTTQ
ncbi:hypothetical protein U9M48_000669 [Paspalum notatum var. saurae]|uniref:Uncharacterized protein n=1 Tax=Paspalum notatum var. saurae TaxID=547442 RepID=A0AAQ3PE62_PASNO